MKKRLLIALLFSGLLVLALASWVVEGMRWAVTRRPRTALAGRPPRQRAPQAA